MTTEKLRRLARWAEKIGAAITQLSSELSEELAKAQTAADPLPQHIEMSRASLTKVNEADIHKDQKKTERELRRSWMIARQLGYRGHMEDWYWLLLKDPKKPASHG
jgi:hypothetical protein